MQMACYNPGLKAWAGAEKMNIGFSQSSFILNGDVGLPGLKRIQQLINLCHRPLKPLLPVPCNFNNAYITLLQYLPVAYIQHVSLFFKQSCAILEKINVVIKVQVQRSFISAVNSGTNR
jgi:hypothetical protein